jgi:signal transduction histidine kinase
MTQTLQLDPATAQLSHSELAELMQTFNDVTVRLQSTHESLRAEVSRLQSELSDTRAQLHRASELASLGEMAAGIAHEVRNPLGSIRLYASVLEEDLADRPTEQIVASKIRGAVQHLDAVVGDVLTFARETKLRCESVEAASMFEQALVACADLISHAGIEVVAQIDADTHIWCDASAVHQALVNVLRNACQAMEHESTERSLNLSAAPMHVLDADGKRVRMMALCVRDTGPGVTDEVVDRLFNPFFTTRDTGTGLGLAIVHRILDAHSGRIQITNCTPPQHPGALVELLFPLTHESGQHALRREE